MTNSHKPLAALFLFLFVIIHSLREQMDRGDRTGICGCEGTWGFATAERDDGPEKFNEKLGRLSKWARLLRIWV